MLFGKSTNPWCMGKSTSKHQKTRVRGAQRTEPGAEGRPDQDGGRVSIPEAQPEIDQGSPDAVNSIGNFKQYIQVLPGVHTR